MPNSGEASRALVGLSAAGDHKSPEACGEFLFLLLLFTEDFRQVFENDF